MKKWILSCKALVLCLAIAIAPGCGQQGQGLPEIPGVKGPIFNVQDGKVMITMKLLQVNAPIGAKIPLPETRGSYLEVAPNVEDGGTLIVAYLDVDDLRDISIGVGDPNTLPDGRPVPGIPGGVLQESLRFDLGQHALNASIYYSQKLFGLYVPFNFDTRGISGYFNIVVQGKNIGMLSLVGSEGAGRPAAGLIFLRLDALKDPQMKKLINMSKRNPHKLY